MVSHAADLYIANRNHIVELYSQVIKYIMERN